MQKCVKSLNKKSTNLINQIGQEMKLGRAF